MEYTVNLETTTWRDTRNINLCVLGGVTDLMVMVCFSYLDSGRAALWRGVSGSGPSLSCTRRGWWRVFSTPLCVRSEVLGTSGRTGTCRDDRDTETGRWMGRTEGDWRREERQTGDDWSERGSEDGLGSGKSTVSLEKTNEGKESCSIFSSYLHRAVSDIWHGELKVHSFISMNILVF